MFPDANKKVQQMLSEIDPNTLEKGMEAISNFMNTAQGKDLMDQINQIDKDVLMNQIQQIDEQVLVDKLNNLDVTAITEKMNNMENEKMLHEVTNDPDLLDKLRKFIDQNSNNR